MTQSTGEFTVSQVQTYKAIAADDPNLLEVLNDWYLDDGRGNPLEFLPADVLDKFKEERAVFIMNEATQDVAVVDEKRFATSYEHRDPNSKYTNLGTSIISNILDKISTIDISEQSEDFVSGMNTVISAINEAIGSNDGEV